MKLSTNHTVQLLVKERGELSTKLYAVSNEGTGFGIAFHGSFEGGEARKVAAAALINFYQAQIDEVDHKLRDLGVDPDG